MSVSSNSVVQTAFFTYRAGLTPTVDSVSPTRGGTGGGTTLTISGSGFP